MGYAIRTDRYRYVEWYSWNKEMKTQGELLASELFDHETDPEENRNLANEPSHAKTLEALSKQLKMGWRSALPE